MPRVIVLGQYWKYVPAIKSLDVSAPAPGPIVADFVARTLPAAIAARDRDSAVENSELARLPGLLLGEVSDAQLSAYEA